MKKSFDFENGELLLINKPYAWTSFDVVASVRYTIRHHLGKRNIKVGHAGTLDPLATGLMLICTGKLTKQITTYQELWKEYRGSLILGATTPSFDRETEIDKTYDISYLTEDVIIQTSKKFTGKFEQIPPLHSAVWIKGKRAYEFARENRSVEISAKSVDIIRFDITSINMPEVNFEVECSKGTYVRSLVRDFGKALQCGAFLSSLCRTRIGDYNIADAFEIPEFKDVVSKS